MHFNRQDNTEYIKSRQRMIRQHLLRMGHQIEIPDNEPLPQVPYPDIKTLN